MSLWWIFLGFVKKKCMQAMAEMAYSLAIYVTKLCSIFYAHIFLRNYTHFFIPVCFWVRHLALGTCWCKRIEENCIDFLDSIHWHKIRKIGWITTAGLPVLIFFSSLPAIFFPYAVIEPPSSFPKIVLPNANCFYFINYIPSSLFIVKNGITTGEREKKKSLIHFGERLSPGTY